MKRIAGKLNEINEATKFNSLKIIEKSVEFCVAHGKTIGVETFEVKQTFNLWFGVLILDLVVYLTVRTNNGTLIL